MKIKTLLLGTLAVFLSLASSQGQIRPSRGKVLVPNSSIEKPLDIGRAAHTNIQVFLPSEPLRYQQTSGPPYGGYAYETPASLACVYGLVTAVTGCSPNAAKSVPVGGARMIAIVDAYDAPNAANDLSAFSTQFGLPPASFQVVYASGVKPAYDMGWEFEESLDVQWAHAMAPEAKIVLVEAASNSFSDLMTAEDVASRMVNAAGGGEVSTTDAQNPINVPRANAPMLTCAVGSTTSAALPRCAIFTASSVGKRYPKPINPTTSRPVSERPAIVANPKRRT